MSFQTAAVFATVCSFLNAQNLITTVAGTDKILPAAGVNALQVALAPFGVTAVDTKGNYYFIDNDSNTVLQLSTNGTLTTVAGNGILGYGGDGGSALMASLNVPYALAFDPNGNLLIADAGNFVVRRVNAVSGVITTIAGTGSFGSLRGENVSAVTTPLGSIGGIAVDASGNIYISDYDHQAVYQVTPQGTISTFVGKAASLNLPFGLAVDSSGSLFVVDQGNSRVLQVTGGKTAPFAGITGQAGYNGDGGQATAATLNKPVGVAVDTSGAVYIADYENNRIRKVAQGVITTVAGTATGGFSGETGSATAVELSLPSGVSVDSTGNIFILDSNSKRIRKVSHGTMSTVAGSTTASLFGENVPATTALLSSPTAVAIDNQRNLYIADGGDHRIRKVTPAGIITTFAGVGTPGYSGDGGQAISASFNNPFGVAVDSSGNVYVADTVNCVIRKILPGGTISTIAGTGACGFNKDGLATATQLYAPEGIAVDTLGNLYIADTKNHLVRMINSSNRVTTIAGNGTAGFAGDGLAGTAASVMLNTPAAVAVDASGNVYVADTGNSAIRKINSKGVISTIAGKGALTALDNPSGVLADNLGNVYISDSQNSRVLMVSAAGVLSVLAGVPNENGFGGDGGPAHNALLSLTVSGLALDGSNNLYIADTNNERIREILAAQPAATATPLSLAFTANAGDAPTAFQTVNLSSIPGVGYSAAASDPWIQVTPSSGTMPAVLQVSVDPGALSAGSVQGRVTITPIGAAPSALTVNVSATINTAVPAALAVDSDGLRFGYVQGADASQQQLIVKNSGGGAFTFTASTSTIDGNNWLTISGGTTAVSAATPGGLVVTASPQGLLPNTYTGAIKLTSSAGSTTIPVIMTISAAGPRILLSQTGLSFQLLAGGTTLPKSFTILNSGQGELDWSASTVTFPSANWLSIDSTNGKLINPLSDYATANVSINAAGLSAGTYFGQVLVTAPGAANQPQIVSVQVTVLPPGSPLGPQVLPGTLIFSGPTGSSPGSQTVKIANPTGQTLTFNSSDAATLTNLSYVPAAGSLPGGGTATITVQPSQLPAGLNTSTLGIRFSDGTVQTVTILTIGSQNVSGNTVAPRAFSTCITVNPYNMPAQITAQPGSSVTLSVIATDCSNNPITFSNSGNVTVQFTPLIGRSPTFTNTPKSGIWEASATMPTTPGIYKASVQAGVYNAAFVCTCSASPAVFTINVSNAPTAQIATPFVADNGVVSAASQIVGLSQASPGSYMSIYAYNVSGGTLATPTVTIGSSPVYVKAFIADLNALYGSAFPAGLGFFNVEVPFDVATSTDLPIVVQTGTGVSNATPVTISPAQPAIFAANAAGFGQGAIVNFPQGQIVDASHPAQAGDIVLIYCTGLGPVDTVLATGQPATTTVNTIYTPVLTIGGQRATVLFHGLAPGFVGLYQINAVIPPGVPSGQAAVTITVNGQTTPANPNGPVFLVAR